MNESWSKKEKEVAREAFDLASENNLKEIIKAVKGRNLETWQDIAALTTLIKKKEKETDMLFDYRYSILIISFANFIRKGWLTFEDIEGLNQEKINQIKNIINL